MNPLVALLLGLPLVFAWTPCGTDSWQRLRWLTSSSSAATGYLLIGVYTLGSSSLFWRWAFLPALFSVSSKRHQKVVRYTVKIGAVLLIVMGIITLTGFMNGITSYFASIGDDAHCFYYRIFLCAGKHAYA